MTHGLSRSNVLAKGHKRTPPQALQLGFLSRENSLPRPNTRQAVIITEKNLTRADCVRRRRKLIGRGSPNTGTIPVPLRRMEDFIEKVTFGQEVPHVSYLFEGLHIEVRRTDRH